jgi:iron(III) transport system ATP-binding protein
MLPVVLSHVTKRYPRRPSPAVDDLSLTLAEGEILALLGPSGSGKTSTLRLIAGFETPDGGSITVGGRVVAEARAGRTVSVAPEARGVGIVFQDYALFPHLTVAANVGFGLHALRASRRQGRVHEILDLVGLGDLGARYPHELSGGQQQRVAVARALAPVPALLLLDEPFSNLDADLREQMRTEVEGVLRATGATAIFVTHDQEEAFTIADRVGVLDRGRLQQLDTPETLYHHPATTFVAEFVGAANFLAGRITAEGISTEIGTFANPQSLGLGTEVRVMVRPHDITFTAAPESATTIVRRSFRGSAVLYGLALPSGQRVYSSHPSSATFPVGLHVRPQAHLLHVVTFPAGATNAREPG